MMNIRKSTLLVGWLNDDDDDTWNDLIWKMRNVYDDNDNDDSLNYPSSCSARQHNPKIFFVTKEKIIICAVVVDQEINNISFSVFFCCQTNHSCIDQWSVEQTNDE